MIARQNEEQGSRQSNMRFCLRQGNLIGQPEDPLLWKASQKGKRRSDDGYRRHRESVAIAEVCLFVRSFVAVRVGTPVA
jgi:hypothetical protein